MRRLDASDVAAAPLWRQEATCGMPAVAATSMQDVVRLLEVERAAAIERGFQEGHAKGLAQAKEVALAEAQAWQHKRERELDAARADYDKARHALEALAGQLAARMDAEVARAEELGIEVAFAAVTRLLGAGYADHSLIGPLVRHALATMATDVDAIVLSAEDMELLDETPGVKVVADTRLAPGQCRLETRLGSYDTGLDVRLEALRHAFLAGLAEHAVERGPR